MLKKIAKLILRKEREEELNKLIPITKEESEYYESLSTGKEEK